MFTAAVASQFYNAKDNTLAYGVMGTATSVPPNFSVETIVYVGEGVNSVMEQWGDALLTRYNKPRSFQDRDLTVRRQDSVGCY